MATQLLDELQIPYLRPLEGKVALVTGASRGIGRAIAKELSDRGAVVVINFFNSIGRAQELRDEIQSCGGESCLMQGDISDRHEARRIIQKLLEVYGRLDVLVNNAGITRDRSIRKMTDEDWSEVIATNLNSIFYCTSAALPAMIEQKFGRIVNIASFSGQAGNFGGELCSQQRRDHCFHQGPCSGTGEVQHHRQCHRARLYFNRHAGRGPHGSARLDQGPDPAPALCAAGRNR